MGTTLRRRFVFPAGDVVTGSPLLDRPLDRVLWTLRTGRIGRTGTEGVDAAVFGFPRSGNTMLAAWLQAVARPGVRVHDGRVTHSALDVLRFTQAGIPIVIPVRNPMDACASFLVRQGRPEDARHGARLLDAYGAWYRMTRRSLASPMVTAMAFEAVTDDPALLAQWTPVVPLLEHDAVAAHAPEVFVEDLRHDLADVVGQGVEQDGVPAP